MRLDNILLEDSNSMYQRLRRQLLKFEDSDEWLYNRTFDIDGRTELWFYKDFYEATHGMREGVLFMDQEWPEHLPNYFKFGRVTKKIHAFGWIPPDFQFYKDEEIETPYFHRLDGPALVEVSHMNTELYRLSKWYISRVNHGTVTKRNNKIPAKFLSIMMEECMIQGRREARNNLKMHNWEGYTISFNLLVDRINKYTDDGYMSKEHRLEQLESFRKNTFLFGLDMVKDQESQISNNADLVEHYIKWFAKWSIDKINDPKYTP